MGRPIAIGMQDGLVRVDVPLLPDPPQEWIEIFNTHSLANVALPRSWNRPVAHAELARLTARPEKMLEYLEHVKQMILATNGIYRGEKVVALSRTRDGMQPIQRPLPGPRPNLEACQRILDQFDPS